MVYRKFVVPASRIMSPALVIVSQQFTRKRSFTFPETAVSITVFPKPQRFGLPRISALGKDSPMEFINSGWPPRAWISSTGVYLHS